MGFGCFDIGAFVPKELGSDSFLFARNCSYASIWLRMTHHLDVLRSQDFHARHFRRWKVGHFQSYWSPMLLVTRTLCFFLQIHVPIVMGELTVNHEITHFQRYQTIITHNGNFDDFLLYIMTPVWVGVIT